MTEHAFKYLVFLEEFNVVLQQKQDKFFFLGEAMRDLQRTLTISPCTKKEFCNTLMNPIIEVGAKSFYSSVRSVSRQRLNLRLPSVCEGKQKI